MNLKLRIKRTFLIVTTVLFVAFTALGLLACGGEKEHDWGAWQVTTPATCVREGVETRVCKNDASHVETRKIDKIPHSYSTEEVAATCVDGGYTVYTCTVCGDSYQKDFTSPTGEHTWDKELSCEEGHTCTVCGATEAATMHDYKLVAETTTDCENAATKTYRCSNCQDEYIETLGEPNDHDIYGVEPVLTLKENETCVYVEVFVCKTCNKEVLGETIEKHEYKARITTEPTCVTNGVKTYRCELCESEYTEDILADESYHKWVAGEVVSGKRTDTCEYCSATKTVTVYTGEAVSAETFKGSEIEMENANMSFDDGVLDTIGDKTVTLSADKLTEDDKTALNLSTEELAQVGDNPIYNFAITDENNENISQFGEENFVTVTLPYTLQDGEDIDSIAIWYIAEDGSLKAFKATYNNGFVTFKTNHFSYYTVTRLTPEQRCELYGHSYTEKVVFPTCTAAGYTLKVCVRCHETVKETGEPALGHNYTQEETPATCTQYGVIRYTCQNCGNSYVQRTPALGHDFELKNSVESDCRTSGYNEYACTRCEATKKEVFPKTEHVFENGKCIYCGIETEKPETPDDCDHTVLYDRTVDLKDYGGCGGIIKLKTCACGEVTVFDMESFRPACDMNSSFKYTETTDKNGNPTMKGEGTCPDCGLYYYMEETMVQDGCTQTISLLLTVKKGNQTIINNATAEYVNKYHQMQKQERISFGCDSYATVISCGDCGEILSVQDLTLNCDVQEPERQEFTDENGLVHVFGEATCPTCGTVIYQEMWTENLSVCESISYERYKITDKDGTVILDTTNGNHNSYHDYKTSYELLGESCEDGVKITRSCIKCGDRYDYTTYSHETVKREEINLATFGACGGTIQSSSCACGEERYFNTDFNGCEFNHSYNTYKDDDGLHYVESRTCRICGLRYDTERITKKIEGECKNQVTVINTVTINGTLIADSTYDYTEEAHNYKLTNTEFLTEEQDCEKGVKLTFTCEDCGESYERETRYHDTFLINTYDLEEYGSTCGGTVNEYACACGREHRVDFNDYDHGYFCDFEYTEFSYDNFNWIEDRITDWKGNDSHYQYGRIYVCAVTEPACGFMIRYANYYVADEDNCAAVRYEKWEFGFNPQTGTCAEVLKYKTGYTVDFHDYETEDYETTENGLRKTVYGKQCTKCGACDIDTNYFNGEGNVIKYTHYRKNNTYKEDRFERVYEYHYGYQYTSSEYTFYWYNKEDSAYWYKYEYTYDLESGCNCTQVYTNSNGDRRTDSYTCHHYYYSERVYDIRPTCTQDGHYHYVCPVCKQAVGYETESPVCHNWHYVSENLYICLDCGLINSNGSSGNIVMEDMTAAYGNGEYYVIGYYNRNNVTFTRYISLVIGEEEIILNGIEVNERTDIRALQFSILAVTTAANERGFEEGSYDVRFTFVPYGADSSFDYALTLTGEDVTKEITVTVNYGETVKIDFVPGKSGVYLITSLSDADTYGYIYDEDGNEIAYNDDGGRNNNFLLTYNFTAGETYKIGVRYYHSDNAGDIPVIINYLGNI